MHIYIYVIYIYVIYVKYMLYIYIYIYVYFFNRRPPLMWFRYMYVYPCICSNPCNYARLSEAQIEELEIWYRKQK